MKCTAELDDYSEFFFFFNVPSVRVAPDLIWRKPKRAFFILFFYLYVLIFSCSGESASIYVLRKRKEARPFKIKARPPSLHSGAARKTSFFEGLYHYCF